MKLHPMHDHYAMIHDGDIVGVVTKFSDAQWGIDLLTGKLDGVHRYIPLHHALREAMTWKP